jgi:hypothetical protein
VIHKLKTWPEPFKAVANGHKTHEIRVNDRGFQVGDMLELLEWDQNLCEYTGHAVFRSVTYITRGGQWGLPNGLCVMSICPPSNAREAGL